MRRWPHAVGIAFGSSCFRYFSHGESDGTLMAMAVGCRNIARDLDETGEQVQLVREGGKGEAADHEYPGAPRPDGRETDPALRAELVLSGETVIGALSLIDGVVVPDRSIVSLLAHLPVSGPNGRGSWVELTPVDGINYIRALHGQLSGYLTVRLLDQPQADNSKGFGAPLAHAETPARTSSSPDAHRNPCA